jgi:16S rRNA (guanine966-N2)-methyltransferase
VKITGGKYRGKTIQAREVHTLRPTSSRVREAVINILHHGRFYNSENYIPDENPSRLEGRRVIDVFCGTGSLGLEALSNGAACATFIDQDPATFKLTRQNVEAIGETRNSTFVRADATQLPTARAKADLIFVDPPYQKDLAVPALKSLIKGKWIENGAIVIIEHDKQDELALPEGYVELDSRMHDNTRITVLQYQAIIASE